MNSSIVKINFDFFCVKFYKQLLLNEVDLAVIFVIKYLLDSENQVITPEIIALYMNLPISQIDKILLKLINKKYIAYVKRNNEFFVTLKPLEDKLFQMYCVYFNKQNFLKSDKKTVEEVELIIDMMKQKFSRDILDIERNFVCEWVLNGFDFNDCKNAVNIAFENGSCNFRAIDDILMNRIK
ncbi:MAG: hypothetical protein J6Y70_00035 [Bacilli bacterium]|nr:hypothetical protein [Bacilli bacterium]